MVNSLTFLGTGTSQGVPVIACDCKVCTSSNQKDKRLRTSVLLSVDNKNIVIDTGPDFRQQMLRANVQHLNAVVFTHEHKDHVAGLDDVRAFNYKQKKDMEVYAGDLVIEALKREFHYVFTTNPYPGIPKINVNRIENKSFKIEGIAFQPISVLHHKLPVFGYRINDLVYITDANHISNEEKSKISGCKYLILNALRKENHLSHFTLNEALELINEINPKQAYLIHMSHLMGLHEEIERELPANVHLAYDGLQIEIE